MIEHPEQEPRLVGGRADGFWANSRQRQEAAEPLGLAGDEGERGDGERFGCRLLVIEPYRAAFGSHGILRNTRRRAADKTLLHGTNQGRARAAESSTRAQHLG